MPVTKRARYEAENRVIDAHKSMVATVRDTDAIRAEYYRLKEEDKREGAAVALERQTV